MKAILTFTLAALALASPALYAGSVAEWTVSITFETDTSGFAGGNMWSVRSSDNDVEAIGCSYKGAVEPVHEAHFPWSHPVNNWAWCQATDPNGVRVFCLTENQHLLDALQAISPFSWIRFEFANLQDIPGLGLVGECTRLDFSTQSRHLPDFKAKNN